MRNFFIRLLRYIFKIRKPESIMITPNELEENRMNYAKEFAKRGYVAEAVDYGETKEASK